MARLLEKTRCNTAYIRRHGKLVEMWECEWKGIRCQDFPRPIESPQMEHYSAADPSSIGRWHAVRYGRMRSRSIVGYDANALYLWALIQDMPTGGCTRRRDENQFRPQHTRPFGHMAVQWLTWESAKNGCAISHQVNGRKKWTGKLPVDEGCAKTRTAYQFHGCFFHGCPKCYDQKMKQTR